MKKPIKKTTPKKVVKAAAKLKDVAIPGKVAVNKTSSRSPKYFYWQNKKNKQWYFHLVGGNGEIQHPSEPCTTKASAIRGIKRIQKNAPLASINQRK